MDREKVINGIQECDLNGGLIGNCPYKGILDLLKEQETGHWIYLENCSNSGVYCSECHTKVFDNYPFKKKFSYFCPHCGTRMEGETERQRT